MAIKFCMHETTLEQPPPLFLTYFQQELIKTFDTSMRPLPITRERAIETVLCADSSLSLCTELTRGPVGPDWAIYWTLGNFSKSVATINLSKSPTFLGNFCKGVKIYHFSGEIIFGQL